MFNHYVHEVTTGATQLIIPDSHTNDKVEWAIQVPTGAAAGIYLGNAGVSTGSTTRGWFVAVGESFSGSNGSSEGAPYVISTAASVNCTVITNS